jgi:hypothetical protein
MVGADHGHLARGGHGGPEPEVCHTLWLGLWPHDAAPVVPRDRVSAERLAPTFAKLLGVPPPTEALGAALPLGGGDAEAEPPAARQVAVRATLAAARDRAHASFRLRGVAVALVLLSLAVAARRAGKGRTLLAAAQPATWAIAAFATLGPGTTLSAIRTQVDFLASATTVLALGAALAWPVARRLGAPAGWVFVVSGAVPACALFVTAGSLGQSHVGDVERLLLPAAGLVPLAVVLGALASSALVRAGGMARGLVRRLALPAARTAR